MIKCGFIVVGSAKALVFNAIVAQYFLLTELGYIDHNNINTMRYVVCSTGGLVYDSYTDLMVLLVPQVPTPGIDVPAVLQLKI